MDTIIQPFFSPTNIVPASMKQTLDVLIVWHVNNAQVAGYLGWDYRCGSGERVTNDEINELIFEGTRRGMVQEDDKFFSKYSDFCAQQRPIIFNGAN